MLQKQTYKKKVVYKPLISIRSPDAEVFSLGGNYVQVFGNSIQLSLVLDKVVSKPISLSGKCKFKHVKKYYNSLLNSQIV